MNNKIFQHLRSEFTKSKIRLIILIVAMISFFIFQKIVLNFYIANKSSGWSDYIFYLFMPIFFLVMIIILVIIFRKKNFNIILSIWSKKRSFEQRKEFLSKIINDRVTVNPKKKYLTSLYLQKKYMGMIVYGEINNRKVWIYQNGIATSFATEGLLPPNTSMWNIEITINSLNSYLGLLKENLLEYDHLDTESRKFNKLYAVDLVDKNFSLQLLDPYIIDLITHSNLTVLEFSDSSLLIQFLFNSKKENLEKKLNGMLYWGEKIAQQVDRNFPLGKYEKK